uniref:Uncharacterized protein n=2 Tax=Gammaproteobacteria TaxID=1236 RepID=A0A514C8T7_MORMO|nr:hypothetical protein [Morganella morganii]QDX15389.1 hypothetical protein [Actinobacillus pleuropneumoniae]
MCEKLFSEKTILYLVPCVYSQIKTCFRFFIKNAVIYEN